MSEQLLEAFAIALVVSVLATPLARRLALATGIVDRPAARKVHLREVPYLGGLAIAVAVLVGTIGGRGTGWRIGVIACAAAVLGLVGLLDDDRTLAAAPRLALQAAAALAAVAAGVRAEPFGIPAYDIFLTVIWIVAVTNTLNLLDNMDGLTGGVAIAVSAGVLALATFGDQSVLAVFAAATCGACIGFLAFNWRPASIFMGDAGALFLGYVLAVSSLALRPAIAPPGSFAVPVLLLAVPLLDTTTVVLARSRRRIPVLQGGRDHLSHRLVALGLRPPVAVGILVGVSLVDAVVAVFVGRGVLALAPAVLIGMAGPAGLAVVASRAKVYPVRVRGWTRRTRHVLLGGAGVLVLFVVPAAVASVVAGFDVAAARRELHRAQDALRDGDTGVAAAAFRSAAGEFDDAGGALRAPLVGLGRFTPVVGANLDALRTVVSVGADLSRVGGDLSTDLDLDRLRVEEGTVPIERVREVAPRLDDAELTIEESARRVRGIDRTYLVAPLSGVVDDLHDTLESSRRAVRRAADAARVVPAMFGGDGTRRYFLAVQNSAEMRATGGFIGNWGILTARDGRLRLDEFDRLAALNPGVGAAERVVHAPEEFLRRYGRFDLAHTWQNVNMSPDFPTVASVMADLLPQSGQPTVDGVIAVDSLGLSALLELTGPVAVAGWPEPIDAGNVVEVTLKSAYERFAQEERVGFLGDAARSVWEAVTHADLGRPDYVAEVLSDAVDGGHLVAWMDQPGEQDLLEDIGAAGVVPPVQGDSLMLVTQNAAGNKADYYLHRALSYDVRLRPDRQTDEATVEGTLSIDLRNDAPDHGLPPIVIGPYDERFLPGENRAFTTVYTPLAFESATLGGRPVPLESLEELGRNSYSTFVSIPASESWRLELVLKGTTALTGGWYRLDLPHQPTLVPDEVEVRVEVPAGWRVTAARPRGERHARSVVVHVDHDVGRTLWVHIERDRSLLDRLRGDN